MCGGSVSVMKELLEDKNRYILSHDIILSCFLAGGQVILTHEIISLYQISDAQNVRMS